MKKKSQFSFKERIAILVLCLGILIYTLLPRFFLKEAHIEWKVTQLDTLEKSFLQYHSAQKMPVLEEASIDFIKLDSCSEEELIQTGISLKMVHTIMNYRSKGGRFRAWKDVEKMYGISPDELKRLKILVVFDEPPKRTSSNVKQEKTPTPIPLININKASVEEWKSLPAIGDYFAKKIVEYRTNLGGFYSIAQVKEVYGLSDSSFERIRPYLEIKFPQLKLIDLNQVDSSTLEQHPYLSKYDAHYIIRYRNEHGAFKSVNDLSTITQLKTERFEKIKPYLMVR